jgi:hypothetical protein
VSRVAGPESVAELLELAEALVALAELALSPPGGERSGPDRRQIVVDADALTSDAPGRCELTDGPALAAETARRLACDAAVVELLEQGGRPLALGRRRRTVTTRRRRALEARETRTRQGLRIDAGTGQPRGTDRMNLADALDAVIDALSERYRTPIFNQASPEARAHQRASSAIATRS